MRKFAYKKFSEGRAAHWLILLYADRVDVAEHRIRSLASLHPDNPITETGVKAEFTHDGIRSRFRAKRVDRKHFWIDPILVGGPWFLSAIVISRLLRRRK